LKQENRVRGSTGHFLLKPLILSVSQICDDSQTSAKFVIHRFILLKPTKFLCSLQSSLKADKTWWYLLISDVFYDTFLVQSLWLANQLQKLHE